MTATAERLSLPEAEQARPDERLAFFSRGTIDVSADVPRRTALEFADLLRLNPAAVLLEGFRQRLEDAVKDVDDGIADRFEALVLKFPSALTKQLYSDIELVVEDYGVSEANDFQVVQIPRGRITGHQALAYPRTPNDYHPKLNLRVQTSFDRSLTVIRGPGDSVESPYPGRWVSLPFNMMEIATVL